MSKYHWVLKYCQNKEAFALASTSIRWESIITPSAVEQEFRHLQFRCPIFLYSRIIDCDSYFATLIDEIDMETLRAFDALPKIVFNSGCRNWELEF